MACIYYLSLYVALTIRWRPRCDWVYDVITVAALINRMDLVETPMSN